jgi:ribosomal protein L37E
MRGAVACPACGGLVFQTDAAICSHCGQPLPPVARDEWQGVRARIVDADPTAAPARDEGGYISGRIIAAEAPPPRRRRGWPPASALKQPLTWAREWPRPRWVGWPLAWALAALATLAIAVTLVGALSTNKQTISPATLRFYRDIDGFFSIGKPEGWRAAAAGDDPFRTTVFTDRTGKASLTLQYSAPSVGSASAAVRTYLELFRDGAPAGTNTQGPDTITLAGETWTQSSVDERNGSGPTVYHVVALASIHGDYTVLIALIDEATVFDVSNARYFQPMLNTLTYLR